MARIRTIKPEFWDDENVGDLSHGARLLFLGCLNLADDEGLLRWNEMFLGSSIFPYDDIKADTIKKWMDELVKSEFVYSYSSKKQNLGWIVTFHKHQRIDKPQLPKFNPPSLKDKRVRAMYYKRDGGLCKICGGEIDLNGRTDICGSKALSVDHIKHKVNGGSDYPSNIRATHLGCNKSRSCKSDEDLDDNYSTHYSMNHSQNDSKNDSATEGKGKEQDSIVSGGGEEETPTSKIENSTDEVKNPPREAPPSRAAPPYGEMYLDECVEIYKSPQYVGTRQTVCMAKYIDEDTLLDWVDAFTLDLTGQGVLTKALSDFCSHFFRWMKFKDMTTNPKSLIHEKKEANGKANSGNQQSADSKEAAMQRNFEKADRWFGNK